MAPAMLLGSLASATIADLRFADLYVGPVTWIGDHSDGDAIKVVFELRDGSFETHTLGDLRRCAWWRLGRPDDVVAIEALLSRPHAPGETLDAERREHRRRAILADQAAARARLATT